MPNFDATKETDRLRAIPAEVDTYYKKVDGVRLPVKIYKRESDTLVLAIHGGGFKAIKEDAEVWSGSWMNFQAQYYADKGFSSAAISYRSIDISEDTDIFDQIDDCKAAVGFIKSQVAFKKLIIMGDSAGAYLALMLGLDKSVGADIVIAANPVIDCTPWSFIAKTPEDLKKASPLEHIKKLDTRFLCLHGNADVTVDFHPTKEFSEKFSDAGTKCEYIELDGAVHAFILSRYKSTDEMVFEYMKHFDRFIEENL